MASDPGFVGAPPHTGALAPEGPTLWIFVPGAWWVDRHRERVPRGGPDDDAGR